MKHRNSYIYFRFFGELNDFLSAPLRQRSFAFPLQFGQTVKDCIEAAGIPHVEVDLVTVNGKSVSFEHRLADKDAINVYPVFELFDISEVQHLRPSPLRKIRFVLDVHLGKLARYLRLLGFDTIYRNKMDDEEIIDIAVKEHRIVLTRDLGILKNGKVTHGYWLRSQFSKEQLREVLIHFQLKRQIRTFTRCLECNGVITPVEKSTIIEQLDEDTIRFFNRFFQCSSCNRIYWEGSHFDRMKEFLSEFEA